jgi:hypothetical protein
LRPIARGAVLSLLLVLPGPLASAEPHPSTPRGDPGKATVDESCVPAHERALVRLDSHDWLAAREDLEHCAEASCPSIVRSECTTELRRLVPRIPSVVFAVRSPEGRDLVDVRVDANGKVLLPRLGAESVPLNPGPYRFDFFGSDGTKAEQEILLREGEVSRRIDVVLAPPALAPGARASSASPSIWTPPVTLSAVTAATGLALFGFFALNGHSEESCRPDCTRQQVDRLRRDYLVADVSLGVALAATAVGGYLIYEQSKTSTAVTARLSHTPGGAVVSTEVNF